MIPSLTKCPSCNGMGFVEWASRMYPYNDQVDDCLNCYEGLVSVEPNEEAPGD